MAIVGFNFNKISAERKDGVKGKINISNNVAITKIGEHDLHMDKGKQDSLKFSFQFTSKFEPGLGNITLEGDLIIIEESKKAKEILDNWKKDKKVSKDIMTDVLNTILARCNIEALIISKELALPPPIPLPKVDNGGPARENTV
jgi:hypothetical protein